jgi:vacuolar-type H+-ATPase subunit F/Vma7
MARIAVIGEPLRVYGYGLAGALTCPVSDQAEALSAWRELPGDVAVVVLTSTAAAWLGDELTSRPGVLHAVMPDIGAAGAAGLASAVP